jgi:tRNA threonylcarbamoyladenosine biosynthesis protein TsaB
MARDRPPAMKRASAPAAAKALQVRDYTPRDFDALCAIDRECYDPAIVYSRSEMRAYLNAPGSDCVVAQASSEIGGFCITVRRGPEGYVVTIDVREKYRKRGIGGALLREAEKRLAAQGVRAISLDTATDNLSAIAFYEKHGYRKIGVRKGYYPNGCDAFAMIKAIRGSA